jgi:hypothetical protein
MRLVSKAPLSFLAAALLLACASRGVEPLAATAPSVANGVSFSRDIAPILEKRCAVCHLTGDEPGGMALHMQAAYDSLVNVASKESPLPRISAGDAERSYILHKLNGTHLTVGGSGVRMPLGAAPLDAAFILALTQWIQAGAPRN